MKAVWIAFFAGIFIGANLGLIVFALLKMASSGYPDIEDVAPHEAYGKNHD